MAPRDTLHPQHAAVASPLVRRVTPLALLILQGLPLTAVAQAQSSWLPRPASSVYTRPAGDAATPAPSPAPAAVKAPPAPAATAPAAAAAPVSPPVPVSPVVRPPAAAPVVQPSAAAPAVAPAPVPTPTVAAPPSGPVLPIGPAPVIPLPQSAQPAIGTDPRSTVLTGQSGDMTSSGNTFRGGASGAADAGSGAQLGPGGAGNARSLRLGVRSTVTFTDNGTLAPTDQKRRDQVGELTPYVLGSLATPDSRGAFSYALRGIARAQNTQPNEIRHDLRAGGDLAIGTPRLRLSGSALVLDVNQSPLQQTLDPALAAPGQRVQYRRLELSPYYVGEIGSALEYQLRYRASTGNDLLAGQTSTDQGGTAFVRGIEAPGRLGWDVAGQVNRRSFENGYSYDYSSFAATTYLPLGADARFGLAAHYAMVGIALDDRGRNRGWGPGIAFDWIPSDRTSLRATAARQYYGNTGTLRFVHRGTTWTVGLNAWQQLLTSSDSGLVYLDPARQLETRNISSSNPIVDDLVRLSLLNPTGFLMATAPIGAGVVMDRRVTGLFGLVGHTNSVLFSGFSVTREMLPLTADAVAGLPTLATAGALLDQRGMGVTVSHLTSPQSAFYMRALMADSRLSSADTFSRLTSYALGYRTALRPEMLGTVEARHTRLRTSQSLSGSYDENAVAATIDVRF